MNRCLYCYNPIEDDSHYHPKCSRKFFDLEVSPCLPYGITELKEVAKNIIQRSVTVPGVQAKLCLQLEKAAKRVIASRWWDYGVIIF